MRQIDTHERRARLAIRHLLTDGANGETIEQVTDSMVGLHSSDPASVFLAARVRMPAATVADIERALYDDRSVVRVLGMRRTLFVVRDAMAPVIHTACTRALFGPQLRRVTKLVEDQGLAADGRSWLGDLMDETEAAIAERGEALAADLREDVPRLKLQLTYGEGTNWAGKAGMSTRVLFLLATDGRIVRARPRGSWISSQYRWAPMDQWMPSWEPPEDTNQARADLLRRWLHAFGPATVEDVKWWTGWTLSQTRKALDVIRAVEVEIDSGTGYVMPDDADPVSWTSEWAALLPGLDPTVMGWKGRAWYLGPHQPRLFDRNGNAGPTVWWNGRVVGGWAQRASGEVVYDLLEDVGSNATTRIESEAARLQEFLGEVVVKPRFRTPLERALTESG